ncbi:M48 family peptidase [bacterium]|nr:MAG: M48 family peptidase [bacterium]
MAQTFAVPVSAEELSSLYQHINREFFDESLPICSIRWSRRLTRAAGNIRVQSRTIALSVPLLVDVWGENAEFEVCGVHCTSRHQALTEILKHEMIHLWLYENKKPCGHTREFRQKAREIGQPRTRHGIALPVPKSGWIYTCLHCGSQLHRRRCFGRRVACAHCCKHSNGGQYDERFRLAGRRIQNNAEAEGVKR